MNEDLKRKNKRSNLIILIIGILVVVGIIAGFGIHNHRVASQAAAEKYARTHFNPNVKIDGVKVGKLTVAKATAKVNKKAKNHVQLRMKNWFIAIIRPHRQSMRQKLKHCLKSNKLRRLQIKPIILLLKI